MYIDFLILLIPTPLVSALFLAASLLFVNFFICFSFLLKERRKRSMPNREFFYFARCVRKLRYYNDVIHSFRFVWKSAVEHDGGD